ncbi:hypothetical protein [Borreliella garinii]|uniref:hypothetical protein n=1 Tax=Borreliella garinii TaxID=29519 RepID=UPI0003FDBB6A|nr:hypothetical protein [Borreliella garinii]
MPIKNQKELSKKTLFGKLENLKSFLKTTYEKEAFKKGKDTQNKLRNAKVYSKNMSCKIKL